MAVATVRLKQDTLNEENKKFAQARLTQPVFLNSIPKSGSHLVRNILRMFVPVDQQYSAQFIQWSLLKQHLKAFDKSACKFSWGHLMFSDASAVELRGVRKLILMRDPYTWVLARTRFFLSNEFEGNVENIKDGSLTIEQLMNLMIFGIYEKAPPLEQLYRFNVAAWLGTDAKPIRYEDVTKQLAQLETGEAEQYFAGLLADCGIGALPADWRERVRIGADRQFSGTARENLTGIGLDIPLELPDAQKRLVDYVAPGLRKLLGYA